jgi:hypothetical protein
MDVWKQVNLMPQTPSGEGNTLTISMHKKNRLCNPVNGRKLHSFRLNIDIAHINYF